MHNFLTPYFVSSCWYRKCRDWVLVSLYHCKMVP